MSLNHPLIRPYFLGGNVALRVYLNSHDKAILTPQSFGKWGGTSKRHWVGSHEVSKCGFHSMNSIVHEAWLYKPRFVPTLPFGSRVGH